MEGIIGMDAKGRVSLRREYTHILLPKLVIAILSRFEVSS